ncbi:MAG: hypothetical protein V5A33_02940 [Halobacteriales archaeon]
MDPGVTHRYEIEFDVPAARRGDFEGWLSSAVVQWAGHESVARFETYRNETAMTSEIKFVFAFETLCDWAQFVESDEHRSAAEHLARLTDHRDAVLWRQGSVKLEPTRGVSTDDAG